MIVLHVLLWEMDDKVLDELRPDYKFIVGKILAGKAHELHQGDNRYLTTCPKCKGQLISCGCMKIAIGVVNNWKPIKKGRVI